ncbi:universal stress protein [Natrarchaeobius halalkaliphilus]|uniref:Universal stress protein n=1 Tax=Natrarchaeobius halalkaliphilus TaxID=1679091 RepID=A0A3N6LZC1_9EURY|nr:universal stress protein [Natrarchaeobius halalkaliphilus]RQG88093.1 universal stress protein [Natrarchaeobius halalkaliphilus]
MSNVLLPIDDDERHAKDQIQTVLNLPLETDELTVTVLHVFTDNPNSASITQLRSTHLIQEALEDEGIAVELDERSNDPADEILSYAEDNAVDVICLAGRKRSKTGKLLFGSVTQDVILNTNLPVLIAGTDSVE